MPRTGGGNYVLPAGNPVAPGTTITSTWGNTTLNDVAAALTQSLARDGQTAPTADLPMAGFRHTTVGLATDALQYARADQVQKNSFRMLTDAAMPSANAYTATVALAVATFTVGQQVYLLPPATNTGPSTLNVNGTGAVAILNPDGTQIAPGILVLGVLVSLYWSGATWSTLNFLPLTGGIVTGPLAVTSGIAVRGTWDVPVPGKGLDIFFAYDNTYIQSYNNDIPTWYPAHYTALDHRWDCNGATKAILSTTSWSLDGNGFVSSALGIGFSGATILAPLDVKIGADNHIVLRDHTGFLVPTPEIGVLNDVGSTWKDLGYMGLATFYPVVDNSFSCGYPGFRWSTIYAATGTINTSDARLKTDVQPSSLGLDFIDALQPVSFKWIEGGTQSERVQDGFELVPGYITFEGEKIPPTRRPKYKDVATPIPGVRSHWGLIAQQVNEALLAQGVTDFGGWVLEDKDDPDSTQSLRYDEFIAPMIKAIQELSAKVKNLEAQLAAQP